MINKINHELAHRFIITELMIRTLERDRKQIDTFKMKLVMGKLFEKAIQDAKKELLEIRNEMGKIGLRLQAENKIDEFFTVYSFVQRGLSEDVRYANNALRNHTMKELERLLNL